MWRRNSSDLSGADPLVLDNTSRDGYYYAYVTGLTYSRSKDLVTWESGGSFVDLSGDLSGSDALWSAPGTAKSLYDPCPAGWRVAPAAAFEGLTPDAESLAGGGKVLFDRDGFHA